MIIVSRSLRTGDGVAQLSISLDINPANIRCRESSTTLYLTTLSLEEGWMSAPTALACSSNKRYMSTYLKCDVHISWLPVSSIGGYAFQHR